MRLLNKSKEFFKYTLLTVIALVILLFCIVQWKASFEKGVDKFLDNYTAVTESRHLEKGYTYHNNETGMYASSSKEAMALIEMSHVPTFFVIIFLIIFLYLAKQALIEYRKVSEFISEQAELEEKSKVIKGE